MVASMAASCSPMLPADTPGFFPIPIELTRILPPRKDGAPRPIVPAWVDGK